MKLPSLALLTRTGWAIGSVAYTQVLRFGANVIMARLVAPEVFGVMAIINSLRTGAELLSDVGIGQNIVASRRGEEVAFLNTAWTMQIVRGLLIAVVLAIGSIPLSRIYPHGEIGPMIALSSLVLVVAGAQSVGKFVAQKRKNIRRLALLEMVVSTLSIVIQIALVWKWPTPWALIWGAIISTILGASASFVASPDVRLRFAFDRSAAREIVGFGKWVFLTSLVYFGATNFDRLYLGTAITLGALGVYSVARSMSEALGVLILRAGDMIVFPAVAGVSDRTTLRGRLAFNRLPLLIVVALAIALLVSTSDLVIALLYNARYQNAAYMLPLLALGLWFTVLATIGESTMLGIAKPMYSAIANAMKLAWLVVFVPLGAATFGPVGAVIAVASSDLARYTGASVGLKIEELSLFWQDALGTILLIVAIVGFRETLSLVGLATNFPTWVEGLAHLAMP